MFKSKIHRATVTHGNVHYVGSLTNRIVAIGTDPAEDVPGVIHDSTTR